MQVLCLSFRSPAARHSNISREGCQFERTCFCETTCGTRIQGELRMDWKVYILTPSQTLPRMQEPYHALSNGNGNSSETLRADICMSFA